MKGLLLAATTGTALVAAVPLATWTEASAASRPALASTQTGVSGKAGLGGAAPVGAQGRVHSPQPLRVRSKANRLSQTYRRLPDGTSVSLRCSVTGQRIYGNRTWYRLTSARHEYVAAHYIKIISGSVPHC
ncbi:hypothetical protein [Actinomadura rupiterrae]|uniref:hypothetical protein n=1 Tax=Actinomadura rupiterrae TaxID=559627 RepID=UPI0020A30217|nr:hypothetical protein [Actinomadura rupiterrae]MCP2337080.1 hypothetical protein [Actinomadura rupiterrae]